MVHERRKLFSSVEVPCTSDVPERGEAHLAAKLDDGLKTPWTQPLLLPVPPRPPDPPFVPTTLPASVEPPPPPQEVKPRRAITIVTPSNSLVGYIVRFTSL